MSLAAFVLSTLRATSTPILIVLLLLLVTLGFSYRGPREGRAGRGGRLLPQDGKRKRKPPPSRLREASPSPPPGLRCEISPSDLSIEERFHVVEHIDADLAVLRERLDQLSQGGDPFFQGAGGRHHHRSPSPKGRGGSGGRGGARGDGKGGGRVLTQTTGRGGGRGNRRRL